MARVVGVLAVICAIGLGGAASAVAVEERQAQSEGPRLEVFFASLGQSRLLVIDLDGGQPLLSGPAVARVELAVPRGYVIDLAKPVGETIGRVVALLSDAAGTGGSSVFTSGEVSVASPAEYAADPMAQACAAGVHGAVWLVSLSVIGLTFELPIFVDALPETDPSGAAYILRWCPLWLPTQTLPGGARLNLASFILLDLVHGPSAQGFYTWNALVTPVAPGSLSPDPSRSFELRATVPLPHTLTLRARYDEKKKSTLLSGKLTAAGKPRAGVEISLSDEFSFSGSVRTNATGEFSVRTPVAQTTRYSASVEVEAGACSGPTSAPGGCLAETVSQPRPASARVVVPKSTDPKRAIRPRDQALARRSNLRTGDFPSGWQAELGEVALCPGLEPDLSSLTVTGQASSPIFVDGGALSEGEVTAVATSSSSVYLTLEQAGRAFARQARLAAAQCVAEMAASAGATVRSVGALRLPRLGDAVRGFRVVAIEGGEVGYADIVFLRIGRVVAQLTFGSSRDILELERSVAAKVAARARRG